MDLSFVRSPFGLTVHQVRKQKKIRRVSLTLPESCEHVPAVKWYGRASSSMWSDSSWKGVWAQPPHWLVCANLRPNRSRPGSYIDIAQHAAKLLWPGCEPSTRVFSATSSFKQEISWRWVPTVRLYGVNVSTPKISKSAASRGTRRKTSSPVDIREYMFVRMLFVEWGFVQQWLSVADPCLLPVSAYWTFARGTNLRSGMIASPGLLRSACLVLVTMRAEPALWVGQGSSGILRKMSRLDHVHMPTHQPTKHHNLRVALLSCSCEELTEPHPNEGLFASSSPRPWGEVLSIVLLLGSSASKLSEDMRYFTYICTSRKRTL